MTNGELDRDLRAIWLRARPAALQRCEAVRAAATGDPEARVLGREAAHKLAGSLGMFGLPVSSVLALELDDCVVAGALDDPARQDEVVGLVVRLIHAIEGDR